MCYNRVSEYNTPQRISARRVSHRKVLDMATSSIPQLRTCSKCGQSYPATTDYFYMRSEASRGGLEAQCKKCRRAYFDARQHTATRKAVVKKYMQSEKGRDAARISARKLRKIYPLKMKARSAISAATRTGKLPRAKTLKCQTCGKSAHEYHHYLGYAEEHWLDVIPLCRKCHMEAERNE